MVATKGAGNYYEPVPLDFLILELLPEDGVVGGIRWKGRRMSDVAEELRDKLGAESDLRKDEVDSRFRSMSSGDVILKRPSGQQSSRGAIWARTKKGSSLLERKEEYLGS
jgi:hypothetical protein